jgi:hypothetical protein
MSNGILNIPLQEGIDAGGLGIFDTFTGTGGPIIFPDQSPDLPPPGEILDEGLAELARRAGIDITAQEAGDLRETVLEGGNIGQAATDIAANIAERKRDSIISSGIASVVPDLLTPFTGINQAVNVVATADNLANLAADFAQDVPVVGPATAEIADFTGDLGQLTFDVTSPAYRGLDVLQRRIIDPITGRIRSVIDPRRLLNFINPFDDDDRRDGDLTQVVNQRGVVAEKKKGTGNIDMDPNAITQTFGGTTGGTGGGGGADASRSDFPTGGGNVVIGSSFTPPSTNVQQETQRISDIMDRRRRGSSQGFNAGGLASIPKYLKGR